ncbi:glycosyltransferase family 2 protein [Leucobacter chromiireducens]|uniref:glycosyltransferase family 2 protein n=1 Tax=Leucobacter chromiireducens TaxID=283877 RepID=UPI000F63FBA8|nr:glycosyltransferase [Leucobacter chromiireducens]
MARPSRTTARRDHTPHASAQKPSTRAAQAPLPSVSVVIPVLDEERMPERCLRALSRQTVSPEEIIVVENGSTDASAAVAERAPLVRVVHEPRTGITYARRGRASQRARAPESRDASRQVRRNLTPVEYPSAPLPYTSCRAGGSSPCS